MARFAHFPAGVRSVAIIAAAAAFVLTGCSGSSDQPGYTPHPDVFALPRRIAVSVAPFESLEQALSAEPTVDWLRDSRSSNAVTLAFAAGEISDHLKLVNLTTTIDTGSSNGGPAILLSLRDYGTVASASATGSRVDYEALGDQGYAIVPVDGSIVITANTRQGLLYGAYSFLEQLGFAWYDPYETQVPSRSTLEGLLRWRSIQAVPRLRLRGFWIYGDQPVPDEFALWAARNKLNLGGRARLALQKKLGLKGWGGHHDLLQQEFSREGLFEEHPDWFALIGGVRRPVEADPPDVYYNPAFWNPEVADYFADRIVERLESGDLRDIDVLNVWPADDRLNRFDQSEEALAVGNETDNMLLFYGNVASRLELAVAAGRLSRPVTLAGISYFKTQEPPTNKAVLSALETRKYLHVFSPLERDWSGPIETDLVNREANRVFLSDIDSWGSLANLEYGVVDYHNLSAYGALGLSDFPHFARNFETLIRGRDALYAYMHPILRNPGPRRITNLLLAQLSWKELSGSIATPEERAEALIDSYFSRRYGLYAEEWRAVHELMSLSVENAKELFGMNSLYWVLFQEQIWNPPFYSRAEAAAYISRYRAGGIQDLPTAFPGLQTVRASFRGLDESIRLQITALDRSAALLAQSLPLDVRRRMESDLVWFEATASRYRLMAATSDFVWAREHGLDFEEPRQRIARELAFLGQTPTLGDTVSPVNQTLFLDFHSQLAGLP